jgi:divalent metal cation (Fe/Co/Zn/Cd) transporter
MRWGWRAGAAVARMWALGTLAAQVLERPVVDGLASIAIGLLLGLIAVVHARETKGLLIGDAARSELVESICRMLH